MTTTNGHCAMCGKRAYFRKRQIQVCPACLNTKRHEQSPEQGQAVARSVGSQKVIPLDAEKIIEWWGR